MKRIKQTKITVWQFLALGYLAVIFLGALCLMLPFATKPGEQTSFTNALFTSTSATCVTGLVPYDTGTHWTAFGQAVILCLIQTGGLGFMTFVSLLFQLLGKQMGLYESKLLMLSAGEENRSNLKRLFKRIFICTFIFELLGATLLSVRFIEDLGVKRGIWFSVFHSVSAFCNAGFDLMGGAFGQEPFVSLTHYAKDPLVSLTIAALIIIGGLGFCVWDDFWQAKGNLKRCNLHTKIVMTVTGALLTVSTLLYLFFERNNPSLIGYSAGEKALVAFFNAVTPRTAGFNTVDMTQFSDSGYLLTVILMFIGGSSASTAGGVKITTFFVIVMGMLSVFRGKRDIELGKRRIHNALLRQALAIFISCLFIVLLATLIICAVEVENQTATLQSVLFETVSAVATVGLSLSLTPTLSIISRYVIILLMYTGRVGILTLALAFGERRDSTTVKKPVDTLLIG